MFQFGVGGMFGVPVAGSPGNPSGPQRFATLQDVSIDIDQKLVELRGQDKFPDDVAHSDITIKGKAAFGRIDIGIYNSLFFGNDIVDGVTVAIENEIGLIGATIATAWAATHAYTLGQIINDTTNLQKVVTAGTSKASTPPVWATGLGDFTADGTVVWENIGPAAASIAVVHAADFGEDLGVINQETGAIFVKVPSAPAVGEYSQTAGAYTFNASDNGTTVLISYTYDKVTGRTLQVVNQIQGYGPAFELWLRMPYQGDNGLHLFRCKSSKMNAPLKKDGYMIPDFEFTAYSNPAGRVLDWFQDTV